MRIILLASLLLFGACKKEEAKPADPVAVDKKVAEPAKPADPVATTPASNPPAAGAVTIANAAEYEKKGMEMTDKLLAIFTTNGKDCDKLAAAMSKFGDENRATFEAIKAFEKANPDAEKAFDQKMKPREKEFEAKLGPAFDACKDHAGMKAAMQKLPLE